MTVQARIGITGAAPQLLARGFDSTFSGRIALRPASGRVWVGRLPLELVATDEAGNQTPLGGELIVVIIPSFGERYIQTKLFDPYRYDGSDHIGA